MASSQTSEEVSSLLPLWVSFNPKNCSALFLKVFQTPVGDSCKLTLKLFFRIKVETSETSFFLHSMSMCSVFSTNYFTMKTWQSFIKAVTWFVSVAYKCAPWHIIWRWEHFKNILYSNHFEHARHFLLYLFEVYVCKEMILSKHWHRGTVWKYLLEKCSREVSQ